MFFCFWKSDFSRFPAYNILVSFLYTVLTTAMLLLQHKRNRFHILVTKNQQHSFWGCNNMSVCTLKSCDYVKKTCKINHSTYQKKTVLIFWCLYRCTNDDGKIERLHFKLRQAIYILFSKYSFLSIRHNLEKKTTLWWVQWSLWVNRIDYY